MKIWYILLLFAFIAYMALGYGATMQHEQAHVEIYRNFDIKAEPHLNNPIVWAKTGVAGYVTVNNITEKAYDEKCTQECKSLHSMNEIITYNNSQITGAIFFLIVILILISSIFYEKLTG